MKVLVATSATQGTRPTDFNYCVDGELVWLSESCFRDAHRLPNPCGCGRAFAGLASHRSTTTALVADLAITYAEYQEALRAGLTAAGWPGEWALDLAAEQEDLAHFWEEGTVVERDLDILSLRRYADGRMR